MNDLCDPYVVRFHPAMTRAHADGRKCCTTRRHQIGEVGQVFVDENLPGQQFRIIDVHHANLWTIAWSNYLEEGFKSDADFVQFWKDLHNGEFNGSKKCYLHFYAPVLDSALILNRGGHDV